MLAWVLVALLVAFTVTVAIAKPMIFFLRKMKFGQKILEIGPKWHMNKQNIPTMGGFMFIIGISAAMLACTLIYYLGNALRNTGWLRALQQGVGTTPDANTMMISGIIVLGLALAYGIVGMVDDMAKIKKQQNAGLTPIQKLVLQVAVAAVFITILRITHGLDTVIWIPFMNSRFSIPWILYIIIAAFIIVGADNAVNLTDGLDGLASGVTFPISIFFTAVGIYQNNIGAAVFAAALAGALAAFLIFNFYPARVFMGDTGSLFLGGAVAGLAFACKMPLILIPIGIIYIWETLSVIIQVTYFKITHGKRIFKMAPFHHHMEMCGWSEKKIVITFSAITAVMCIVAWFFGVIPQ